MWRDIMKESVEDLMSPNLWLALPAEMVGTLVVTLLGCGTWITWDNFQPNILTVALTFGLAVATVTWVFFHISGGHVNPAVTIAALFTRRVSIIRGVLYIIAQIIGGIIGAGILYGLTPEDIQSDLGANALGKNVTSAQGFGVELITTFVYVLSVFASQDDKRTDLQGSFPLTVGLAVVLCHLFAVPYTMGSMNPARSFGPALIADAFDDHWVFWVGPLVGGVVAGLIYDYVFAAGANFASAKKCLLRTKKPRKQPEAEKAPLEEVKTDPIELEDAKLLEPEKEGENVEAKEEDGAKAEVEEVNEKEKPAEEKPAE